jgi:hypothetical protein
VCACLGLFGVQKHPYLALRMACIKGMAHYMHKSEMKKKGFIKNKVVERIVKTSVNEATLIPFTQCNPTIF